MLTCVISAAVFFIAGAFLGAQRAKGKVLLFVSNLEAEAKAEEAALLAKIKDIL
jgi:hypothetical protein